MSFDALAFMVGAWEHPDFDLNFNDLRGASMLGVLRGVRDSKLAYFEFFCFEDTPSGVMLRAYPRGELGGVYKLEPVLPRVTRLSFSQPGPAKYQTLYWEGRGTTLIVGFSGMSDGHAVGREWEFARRAPFC